MILFYRKTKCYLEYQNVAAHEIHKNIKIILNVYFSQKREQNILL